MSYPTLLRFETFQYSIGLFYLDLIIIYILFEIHACPYNNPLILRIYYINNVVYHVTYYWQLSNLFRDGRINTHVYIKCLQHLGDMRSPRLQLGLLPWSSPIYWCDFKTAAPCGIKQRKLENAVYEDLEVFTFYIYILIPILTHKFYGKYVYFNKDFKKVKIIKNIQFIGWTESRTNTTAVTTQAWANFPQHIATCH